MNLRLISHSLLLLAGVASAGGKPPADLPARLEAWRRDLPGGIAAVWVDAEGVAFAQAGNFSTGDARPLMPDTRFQIGSVTKVFTALLLAESERAGKVARGEAAAKYLLPAGDPDQAKLAAITLLTLTTHSSGLPRLPANLGPNPDAADNPYGRHDRADTVAALRLHGPTAPVGRAVAYSNFGVGVLGEALGAAWGTSYAEALRERVLAPLQMAGASLATEGAAVPADLAPGHAAGQRVPRWTFLAAAPAGAIEATPRELGVFLAFCLGRTESPLRAALAATLVAQRDAPEVGGRIGLGWFIAGRPDRPIYWHNGATNGYHAFLAFSPQEGRGIALLTNDAKSCDALGRSLLGFGPTPAVDRKIPNAADYPGRYPLAPTFALDVTARDGALYVQGTGQPSAPLRRVAADRFAVEGVPAEVSFARDAAGQVTSLTLHQNGKDMVAPRQALPEQPREVPLPVETVREYVGEYALAPTAIFTITEAQGALWVQLTGQPKFPVFASARDEFFYQAVAARLSFERGAGGKVVAVVLHQNGREMRAPRRE